MELPFSEVITIDRHLDVGELRSYLNTAPLDDLRDATTPAPPAADERGRSAQQFVVDVVVRRGSDTRRVTCTGRDIYAVSAPIVVEGAVRLLDGRHRGPGALAPGEAFDAGDVLAALGRDIDIVCPGGSRCGSRTDRRVRAGGWSSPWGRAPRSHRRHGQSAAAGTWTPDEEWAVSAVDRLACRS